MGGDSSKPQQGQIPADVNPEDQNPFFVEELEKVSLKNRRQVSYYWIDPKVYNAQNQKYFNQFLANFKIQSFTSLQALRSELDEIQNNQIIKVITAASLDDDDYRGLQNQPKVAQLFLFCGNQQRAKLLCKNFNKIKGYALKSLQMIELLKKFQLEDKLEVPPCTLLCMLDEDRKLLNRYRLNYFCITSKQLKSKSKEDFVRLAKALTPDQTDKITKFENEYSLTLSGNEAHAQTLQWSFDESFYWHLIEALPKATTDPKKIAYLRLPFIDLFQAIFQRKISKMPEQLYIVAQLNNEEISKLRQHESLDNFIIFTSFMKGYTKKADAIKQFKQNQKSFLFVVTFTQRKRQSNLDFGFVISEDKNIKKNVLFNIYNFFQLEALQPEKRTGTLIYGPLAQAFYNRADQTSKKRVTQNESILLRNYDYIEELIKNDNSQAVILQISGYFKQSLQIYDRKVEYLRKIKAPETQLAKYIILRGDSYRMNEDYEQAEKDYRSVTHQDFKILAQLHLLELYIRKGDEKQSQIIQMLQQPSIMRRLKQKFPQQGFKAENYIAVQWMKQGHFKEALKKYKNLKSEATVHYQYRFEGIPVVHDIFRNMATCEAKLNNHEEALNLLNSTKQWQLVCQGQSAGLALTETMIQCVYEQIGNKQSVQKTAESLNTLMQSINLQQKRYLNQSLIAISMGLRPKDINQSRPVVNVNNSGVNINLNPPVNVNNSGVSINLNPTTNVNNSLVNVNLNPPVQHNNFNVNNSIVQINTSGNRPKQPANINNSSVDIKL